MVVTYLTRELRRRYRQTLLIGIGLAIGIGLVITVTAASAGVSQAQSEVLHSLYGVGTDITVSKTAARGSGGPAHFGFGAPSGAQAGQAFSHDSLTTGAQGTLASSSVDSVSKLTHVAAVSSALQLVDLNIQGHYSSTTGGSGTPSSGSSGARPIQVNTTDIDGVGVDAGGLGPVTSSQITKGSYFTTADASADDAIVSSSYAKQHSLSVGSSVTVAGTSFKVIGIASPPSTSTGDIFIPLAAAQKAANLSGKVTQIYVSAASAAQVDSVQSAIEKAVPGATVTTSSELADQITGSLSGASTIITKLGLWLAVAVLIVAFGIAILLTTSAVSRRVREFGTLKAIGWPSRRIVGQVMAEALVQGVLGGIVGVALGYAGAALVTHLAPPLTAQAGTGTSSTGTGTHATGGGGSRFGGAGSGHGFPGRGAFGANSHLITVHLTAAIQTDALILAVALAIAGGLIAGLFGGWRAASLRPAAALRRIE